MTRVEIIKRMNELETARFYLSMKDRWSTKDFSKDTEIEWELRFLAEELKQAA